MVTRTLSALVMALFAVTIGSSQPKLVVVQGNSLNFGDALTDTKVTKEVTIKNMGKDTLRILEAKAQCGCTATLLKDSTLAPHDSTKLGITFDTRNYPPGSVIKHVYI